jgi:hypothetical protein
MIALERQLETLQKELAMLKAQTGAYGSNENRSH